MLDLLNSRVIVGKRHYKITSDGENDESPEESCDGDGQLPENVQSEEEENECEERLEVVNRQNVVDEREVFHFKFEHLSC